MEKTGGKYTSCAHVAAQGLCGHELAQMGCAKSCKNTKVKGQMTKQQKKEAFVDPFAGARSLSSKIAAKKCRAKCGVVFK